MSQLLKSRRKRHIMTALIACLLLTSILASLVLWIGSTRFIVPNRRALEQRHFDLLAKPDDYGMRLKPFEAISEDGTALKGILATRSPAPGTAKKTRAMLARLQEHGITSMEPPRGTIVLLHGRGGRKEDLLSVAQRFVAADFRCVVYDARAQGKSGGDYCTFGKKETGDLRAVLDHVADALATSGASIGPIGLFGNSLGAAVALQSMNSVPESQAIVAVAPFTNLPEIVSRSGRRMINRHLPEWLSRSCMHVGGWRAGFDPFAIKPVESAASSSVPLFVAHGTLDGVIPVEHGKNVFEAAGTPHKIWREISSGKHSNILAEGGDDLYEEMILFYLQHLGNLENSLTESAPHAAIESRLSARPGSE